MSIRISLAVIVFALIIFSTVGCETDTASEIGLDIEVVRGSGNQITKEFPVSDFDRVSLEGVGQVVITQSGEESLVVATDDNILKYIEVSVVGRTLTMTYGDEARNMSIRPSETNKFWLSVKELAGISIVGAGDVHASSLSADRLELVISGAGSVDIDDLQANQFETRISGAGNINVNGNVVDQDVSLSGVSNYKGGALESQTARIEVIGVGNAIVWAHDSLDVTIDGIGGVDYYGTPDITESIRFGGNLTRLVIP